MRQLAELLIDAGRLDAGGLERASGLAAVSGERLEVVLTRLGLVSDEDMAWALAGHLGLPRARPEDLPERPLLDGRISVEFLRRARVLPLSEGADGLLLAMADPTDAYALDAVRLVADGPVRPAVATPAEIERGLGRLYGGESAPHAAAEGAKVRLEDVERLEDLASEAPVVRLLQRILGEAVQQRASDVHVEPFEGRLRLRLRVDGVLRDLPAPPLALEPAIVSRIKVMARLDIAERRLPQDGRMRVNVGGREIDVRVSCVPTLYGESVVLRLLDRAQAPLSLVELGFADDLARGLDRQLARPNGILLVTGPTGSGKTTTLYAALQRLNAVERKILTVEDPVEYQLDGINQIQVRPRIGLDFADALRALLRQDPDVILVGEIRDRETARIAVQASLTGHLVLSTLHTNGAAAALTRLVDMGVEPYLLISSLNGVLAQRLVRRLCPACREPWEPPAALLRELELPAGAPLWRPKGCAACGGVGYRGRTVIGELLPVDDAVRRLLLDGADDRTIHAAAAAGGMRTLRGDGLAKAMAGETALDEVLRVTAAG